MSHVTQLVRGNMLKEKSDERAALLLHRKHKEQKIEWTKDDLTCYGVYCCWNLKALMCTVFKCVTFPDSLQPVNK